MLSTTVAAPKTRGADTCRDVVALFPAAEDTAPPTAEVTEAMIPPGEVPLADALPLAMIPPGDVPLAPALVPT